MDIENVSFQIIAHSGEGRSLAFEALKEYRAGNLDKAKELIKKAKDEITEAHRVQTDLLFKEANGEEIEMNIMLVHAQDHFMTSMLAADLIEEMIETFEARKEF
jgi:PTS system cellobiose-specific IIA component